MRIIKRPRFRNCDLRLRCSKQKKTNKELTQFFSLQIHGERYPIPPEERHAQDVHLVLASTTQMHPVPHRSAKSPGDCGGGEDPIGEHLLRRLRIGSCWRQVSSSL
ncbi:PREDICTED: uncharacterized protein LOC108556981 [Nicrophorus vespilloides]|uniref:Uncharacterized protein LOC108556981 n=1 Tax=Nicrophorus vespilloides TaxID=110193 RepID=A0ABM1M2N2_NICVS|nr:PREDICTED: uncharacterized protein LOC108556981 [Nicrophorus vespilloides]